MPYDSSPHYANDFLVFQSTTFEVFIENRIIKRRVLF